VLSQDRPLRFVDLLFTPSLSEVCPLTVLEAFHCGVPVLATRSTPFHSDLDPSAWPEGFLQVQDLPALNERSHSRLGVAPAVARDLAGKFLELAARMRPPDDPCRIQLSQAAFQAGFDQGRMFQLLNQIYDEVVARHHTLKQTH
jgi:glycosyltransferase involved in cell wall biosynthesis